MKKFGMTLTYVFVLMSLISFSSRDLYAGETLIVRVDGLSCAFCAYSLEEHLKALEGVEQVEINLEKGTASLRLREGKGLTDEALKQAVEESGFTPRSITRTDK